MKNIYKFSIITFIIISIFIGNEWLTHSTLKEEGMNIQALYTLALNTLAGHDENLNEGVQYYNVDLSNVPYEGTEEWKTNQLGSKSEAVYIEDTANVESKVRRKTLNFKLLKVERSINRTIVIGSKERPYFGGVGLTMEFAQHGKDWELLRQKVLWIN